MGKKNELEFESKGAMRIAVTDLKDYVEGVLRFEWLGNYLILHFLMRDIREGHKEKQRIFNTAIFPHAVWMKLIGRF